MQWNNFIEEIVAADLASGRFTRPVMTRFPPEPGGYLHIGHAKGILASYLTAKRFGGFFNLRLDDTDPEKDYGKFVDIVIDDVRSLGIDLRRRIFYASDYFEKLHEHAVELIRRGLAFVCDLSEEELPLYRGDFYTPGRPSPYRDRSVEQNLHLFEEMTAGRYPEGSKVLRAKIDYNHGNVLMRDPVIYRILETPHYRRGSTWHVYPRYDFAHCLSDAIEGVTHSLCGKEFEVHRPLYDWFLHVLEVPEPPKQIEYAELKLSNTILGKRHIRKLNSLGLVSGWDDPQLLTLRGLWRRGYTPRILETFFEKAGLSRTPGMIDIRLLEACCREELNKTAPRRFAVLDPLPVVVENYPEDECEAIPAENNPEDHAADCRPLHFSKRLYIERADFMVEPPKGYFRLSPGSQVRLRYGYIVTCTGYKTDPDTGLVTGITVRYDPETRNKNAPDGRKVRGTIHWLSARDAVPIRVRLFDHMVNTEDASELATEDQLLAAVNRCAVTEIHSAVGEPALADADPDSTFQFERLGYFHLDGTVYNRVATLKDSWTRKIMHGVQHE